MIPTHTTDGFLPEGIYLAPWSSFTDRFATTARRAALVGGLRTVLTHLADAGCVAVLIGGSFVTTKRTPGDVDVLYSLDGVDFEQLHDIFQGPGGRPAIKALFGVDLFPAQLIEARSGLTFPEFFQTRKDGLGRCGVVQINLVTLSEA